MVVSNLNVQRQDAVMYYLFLILYILLQLYVSTSSTGYFNEQLLCSLQMQFLCPVISCLFIIHVYAILIKE